MYLQITTKCNMKCQHCCYSCTMRGKHGDYHTILDAIQFATGYTSMITIGGGEPTLHPQFFDILRRCLDRFDFVWLASNGSQTNAMYRLSNIIDGCDFESFQNECTCGKDDLELFENYGCTCHEKYDSEIIYQENKLSVALSLDCFHDPIDDRIIDLWNRRSKVKFGESSYYEIRNASEFRDGVSAQGRAKKTGVGWSDHCVCNDWIVRSDGKIKMCGCTRSPVIGNIWDGIDIKWQEKMDNNEEYQNTRCYRNR